MFLLHSCPAFQCICIISVDDRLEYFKTYYPSFFHPLIINHLSHRVI
jgi:hypothetical protein